MANPVLLAVDDDPGVLRAIERDLRHKYGNRFRIMQANSGAKALMILQQIRLRNESVGLLLVDQRMPQMTGTEFLERSIALFPDAKRVLLTTYADTDAAICAINTAKIDYYLLKPWEPPDECLYPVLSALLDDWLASFHPPFTGIRIISSRWLPQLHQIKDFLVCNHVPYQWLDIEAEAEARQLIAYAGVEAEIDCLPMVLFPNGSHLMQPTNLQIAETIGLEIHAEQSFYDLVIVGAGLAGLAAAVYGASEGLRTVLIKEAPEGQVETSSCVEDYLGFPTGLSGANLARRAMTQAKRFGADILSSQEVINIQIKDSYRRVLLTDGTDISCHAMVISTGVSYCTLEVPGIKQLTGMGVCYGAAITEALSCQDDEVYIVGSANSAGQAAICLAKYAHHVTLLVGSNSLRKSMSKFLTDQIETTSNISVQFHTHVVQVKGENSLEAITTVNTETGELKTLNTQFLFILIGAHPRTDWLANTLERDEQGFILSGSDLIGNERHVTKWKLERTPFPLESSVPGIFVAGDARHGSVKRVASAIEEGAMAVQFVHQYLNYNKV